MIKVEEQQSTVASRLRDRAGMDVDLPENSAGFEMTTEVAAVRNADLDVFAVEVDRAWDKLAENLVAHVSSTVDVTTTATGNVLTYGTEGLTFDTFYEALDAMEWSLTDDGGLSVPSIVMHPDTFKNLPLQTLEQRAKMDQLKQRKNEELLARRRCRRLS